MGEMFSSNRDALINPYVLYFSQVPVPGHGQEIFRRKVAPPEPAFTDRLQPADTKDLQGYSEPPLPRDFGKVVSSEGGTGALPA